MRTKTATARLARGLPAGRRPRVVISTDQVDSERDRVMQAGLTFRERLRVTFAHSYHALPVGLVTGIDRFPHRTEAEFEWFENDPDAARVRNIYDQGGLDASIGFQVEEAVPNELGGYDIRRARVVEFALTAVPANENAMALVKSLGLGRADVDLTKADVLVALREEINKQAAEKVAGVVARTRWELTPPGGQLFVLADEVERGLHPLDVVAAFREWSREVGEMVGKEMKRHLNSALGRVD